MNKLLMIAMAAGVALVSTASAEARDGCGPGFHRGPYGHCRPNGGPGPVIVGGGPVVGIVGAPRIGTFYHGRGYWDGHRYWAHRGGREGHWRYN
ncbi:GCG_CRPN prefix-to-repeats domain-containing protein [Novosphingobium sp.]|uniref:GCG_CRPN prefix-to-repeats domain-containing protein n=1 Tax=Novosphingobium sp. TaxID=1874826 RepID=UPI003B51A1A0